MPMDIDVLLESCGDLGWSSQNTILNEYHTKRRAAERKLRNFDRLTAMERSSGSEFSRKHLGKVTPDRYSKSQRRTVGKRIYTPNISAADGGIKLRGEIVGDDSHSGWLPALHDLRMEDADTARDERMDAYKNRKRVRTEIIKRHEANTGRAMPSSKADEHPDYKEADARVKAAEDAVKLAEKKQREVERHADIHDVDNGEPMSAAEIAKRVAKHKTKVAERQHGGSKLRAQRKHEAKLAHKNLNPKPEPAPQPAPPSSQPAQNTTKANPKPSTTSPQSSPPPQQTPQSPTPATSNKPKFQIKGKHVAGAALAVTGVTAAGLAARHIYKKRQERKRKEREAAEEAAKREARKPINRLKRVFTQH